MFKEKFKLQKCRRRNAQTSESQTFKENFFKLQKVRCLRMFKFHEVRCLRKCSHFRTTDVSGKRLTSESQIFEKKF